eukprot:6193700-Pleurochrysis_carterae.AAC.1
MSRHVRGVKLSPETLSQATESLSNVAHTSTHQLLDLRLFIAPPPAFRFPRGNILSDKNCAFRSVCSSDTARCEPSFHFLFAAVAKELGTVSGMETGARATTRHVPRRVRGRLQSQLYTWMYMSCSVSSTSYTHKHSELVLALLSLRALAPVEVALEIAPGFAPRLKSGKASIPVQGARSRRSTRAREPARVPE